MIQKTHYLIKVLVVLSWILFIGICIEAGGFIFNTFFTLIVNPEGASKFWTEVDLSHLYYYNQSHFVTLTTLMIIVAVLRAVLFYSIVKIFYDKKLDVLQPFSETVRRFILNIAYLALGIGIFSFWGAQFTEKLILQGIKMPDLQHLRIGGADVWLFMFVILLVIAHMFKKGIELQNENELTI